MRKLRIIIFLFYFVYSFSINAQDFNQLRDSFVTQYYSQYLNNKTTFAYSCIFNFIDKKFVIEELKTHNTFPILNSYSSSEGTISLSSEEINYIIEALNSQNNIGFNSLTIPNSERISSKKYNEILKDPNKGWNFIEQKYGKDFHRFSIPIILRNNKLCAFYHEIYFNFGMFSIFKYENGEWVEYLVHIWQH